MEKRECIFFYGSGYRVHGSSVDFSTVEVSPTILIPKTEEELNQLDPEVNYNLGVTPKEAYLSMRCCRVAYIVNNLTKKYVRALTNDLNIRVPCGLPLEERMVILAQKIFDGKYTNGVLRTLTWGCEATWRLNSSDYYNKVRETLRPSITEMLAAYAEEV